MQTVGSELAVKRMNLWNQGLGFVSTVQAGGGGVMFSWYTPGPLLPLTHRWNDSQTEYCC